MSNQREHSAYSRLKTRVTRPKDRFERIENGVGDGFLDVNYCIASAEGWIEIKCPHEPVRDTSALFGNSHPVLLAQRNWMLKQTNAGGRSFLFIATEKRLIVMNGAVVAMLNAAVNELPATELERMAIWRATPPVRDPNKWYDLRQLLCMPT